jgi:hypothetical protein
MNNMYNNIEDIDELSQLMNNTDISSLQKSNNEINEKQKVIVFCVPGRQFNSRFLLNWSELLLKCLVNNYRPILCQENDRDIFIQRNKCLGGNILKDNSDQKPFQGELEYDYLVWIDPNVIFTYDDLTKLLNSKYDVTSGVYILNNLNNITNVVHKFDYDFYKKNGTFNFLVQDNIINLEKINNRYFEAEIVDLGWVCMKKGIAEKIQYPWFEPHNNKDESVNLFTDSYSYCKKLKNEGIKIMVDSNIKMNYSEL